MLTIILAVWLWFAESRRWVRMLGLAAVGAVILQGILGGLRVTMLKDQIGIFHACLAQAFFALMVIIALVNSRFWREHVAAIRDGELLRGIALLTTVRQHRERLGKASRPEIFKRRWLHFLNLVK